MILERRQHQQNEHQFTAHCIDLDEIAQQARPHRLCAIKKTFAQFAAIGEVRYDRAGLQQHTAFLGNRQRSGNRLQ